MGTDAHGLKDEQIDGPDRCSSLPKKMRRTAKHRVKHRQWAWLFVVAMIGLVVGLLLPLGPNDPPTPGEPPNESNRIHHPQGFSIVLPPHWTVLVHNIGSPHIIGMPRCNPPVRAPVGLSVVKLGTK